jgi:hypothetical protein
MVEAPYRRLPVHFSRRLWIPLLLRLFLLSSPSPLLAQETPLPVLHRRGDRDWLAEMDTSSRGKTTLPSEASGEYRLGGMGEAIEMDLEPDRLSGYIARLGDRESDEGAPLTFFFATSVLRGEQLSFTTRQVHGTWFSFQGTIVRGKARSKLEDGYYRLQGTLVLHDAATRSEQAREVSLPLARQYVHG